MQTQGMRDVQQMTELHLATGLHPLDRRPVDAGGVGEGFLGHVLVQSPDADAVPCGPAGVDDPLRLIGWHSVNALWIMIIRQQQI